MKIAAALLLASGVFGQTPGIIFGPGPNPPLLQLKQFLELTDSQYAQIFQNIDQYQRTLNSYRQRIGELQRDIAIETAREQPSSQELGTRYVEVEINCRLMVEEGAKLRSRNQGLLTTAQKSKLQVLLDAIKLFPLIGEAQQASVLDVAFTPFPGNIIPVARIVDPAVPGAISTPVFLAPGCGAGSFGSVISLTP